MKEKTLKSSRFAGAEKVVSNARGRLVRCEKSMADINHCEGLLGCAMIWDGPVTTWQSAIKSDNRSDIKQCYAVK